MVSFIIDYKTMASRKRYLLDVRRPLTQEENLEYKTICYYLELKKKKTKLNKRILVV